MKLRGTAILVCENFLNFFVSKRDGLLYISEAFRRRGPRGPAPLLLALPSNT